MCGLQASLWISRHIGNIPLDLGRERIQNLWEYSINDTNIFLQIKNGTDVVRERAIKYLHLKLKTEGGQLLNKDSEITLFKEIKGCVMVSTNCIAQKC